MINNITQKNKDWKIKELREVCEIKSGKNQSKVINPNGKYPIYGSSGIFGYAHEYICEENTTIIGRKGTINSPIYVTTKFWNVDTAFGLCAKDDLDSKFLFYFCLGFNFKKLDKSTTIPSLSKGDLLAIKLPIPPLKIQQSIVSKIEELFSELDKGIEDLKTAQQQLKTYRQSVLKWAFEGKLTNKKINEGELPKGWEIMKLGELFSESPQNGLYKSSTEYGEGTPIIRIDGFYDGVILDDSQIKKVKLSEEEINKYLISIGDILINRVNSMPYLGKCGLVKHLNERTVFESNIMKIRVNKEIAIPEYISKFLTSKKGLHELRKNAKQAVNQASINQTDVSNVIIPLPQLKDQCLIVQEIESRLSVADKMEESINQSLQQAEALRQSILKKAFSGELI